MTKETRNKMIADAYRAAKSGIESRKYSGESLEVLELYVDVYRSGVQATNDGKRFERGQSLRDAANAWQAADRIDTCINICTCLAPAVAAVTAGAVPSRNVGKWFARGIEKPDLSEFERSHIAITRKPDRPSGRGDYWN